MVCWLVKSSNNGGYLYGIRSRDVVRKGVGEVDGSVSVSGGICWVVQVVLIKNMCDSMKYCILLCCLYDYRNLKS